MITAISVLFLGWVFFVFAVVNLARVVYDYALQKEGSTGFCAILRMLLFSAALTGWYYLVFYRSPFLL